VATKSWSTREWERLTRAIRRVTYNVSREDRLTLLNMVPRNRSWIVHRQTAGHRRAYVYGAGRGEDKPNPVATALKGSGEHVTVCQILEENGRCYLGCRLEQAPDYHERLMASLKRHGIEV
jgi:hypothetical protein